MSDWRVDDAFGMVPLWLLDAKVSDRAVRLYAMLSGMRDYGTDMTTVGRSKLANRLGCSTDSLDRAKKELEDVQAITVERRQVEGAISRNTYTIHRSRPGSRTGADLPPTGSRTDADLHSSIDERSSSPSGEIDPRAVRVPSGSEAGVEHVVNVRGRNGKGTCTCQGFKARKDCRHISIARDMIGLGDIAKRQPQSVGGKPVRAHEHDLCDEILAAFNGSSGKRFAGAEWRRAIIGRIREHPDLDVTAHREIIKRQFADPWWKGDPTPSVIYGNGKVFDSCLNGIRGRSDNDDDGADAYN